MNRFLTFSHLISKHSRRAVVTIIGGTLLVGTWSPLPIAAQADNAVPQPIPAGQMALPEAIRERLLTFVAEDLGLPESALRITEVTPMVWPDPCLGVPNPVELCAAVQTPGWRVELFDGEVYRVYRADQQAQEIRAERPLPADLEEFPRLTASRVLDDIVQKYGLPLEQLDIVATRSRTWDGCLGLAGPADACPQIAIMGWQVIVTAPNYVWVYHTNQDGTDLRLNEAASQLGDAVSVPEFIDRATCIPAEAEALLTVTTTGGLAGRSEQTVLYSNGAIARSTNGDVQMTQLSEADLAAFIDQVYSLRLERLAGLHYPPLPGTADSFQVTVKLGTYEEIRYDDVALPQLPAVLQQFHTLWHGLPVASLPCGATPPSASAL